MGEEAGKLEGILVTANPLAFPLFISAFVKQQLLKMDQNNKHHLSGIFLEGRSRLLPANTQAQGPAGPQKQSHDRPACLVALMHLWSLTPPKVVGRGHC